MASARIALAAIVLAALAWFAFFSGIRILSNPEDFRAFYCGGVAVATGHDPYLAEPLRACEVRETLAAGLSPYTQLAVPAPLPGYVFAPLALVARLPFPAATSLYVLATAAALFGTIVILQKLVPFSPLAIGACFAFGDALFSLLHGQIVPIVVCAVCACAFEVKRGKYGAAAAYAAVASIEPHVALPIWISLALLRSGTRRPLIVAAAVLAAAAVATIGLAENVEYVTRVLPAHARSEMTAPNQYSLTTLLVRFGAGSETALALGNLSYAAACAFGIITARRLANAFDAPELLVLVPPASTLLGGPFVHITQMAIAVPALLVLAARMPERRASYCIALIALAVPWGDLVDDSVAGTIVDIVVVGSAVGLGIWKLDYRGTGFAVAAGLALGFAERAIYALAPAVTKNPGPAIAVVADARLLAEATWRAYMDSAKMLDPRVYAAICLPTWAGLTIMIVAASFSLQATRSTRSRARRSERAT